MKEKKHKKEKKEKKKHHKKEKKSGSSKKRKRSQSSDSDGSDSDSGLSFTAAAPAAAAVAAPSFADLYPMPRRRVGGLSAGPIASLPESAAELRKRNERAERFVVSDAEMALAERKKAAAPPPHYATTHGGTVMGHSLELEKSYTRLTTLPNAADVRPLPVLREAFALVGRKVCACSSTSGASRACCRCTAHVACL